MKIKALRVAEAGLFTDGVAVEALSGRLDVLIAPNEAGKSTLFRALRALFSDAHTSTSSKHDLGMLKPRGGGSPLIECDFEAEGRDWRLRKRYGRGKLAELSDLSNGRLIARGADAETEITRLLARRAERTGLLWVEQGASFEPPNLDRGTSAMVSDLIEREVAEAAGGGELRTIRERAEAELAKLVTPATSKPRAGGPYALALRERDRLQLEHGAASQAAASLEQRLQTLSRLVEEQARLADPEVLRLRRQALEKSRADLELARLRETRRKEAEARRDHAVIGAEAAKTAVRDLDTRLQEAAALEAARTELAATLKRLTGERAAADAKVRDGQSVLAGTTELMHRLRRRLAAAHAAARATALRQRQGEIAARLALVEAVIEQGTTTRAALEANGATDAVLDKLAALQRQVELHALALSASAPVIDVIYATGAAGRIRSGSAAIADGTRLVAVEPTTLEIDGIGRIVVTPGGGRERKDSERQQARAEAELAALLAQIGAATLDDARRLGAERRELAAIRAQCIARLKDLAPQGVDALRSETAVIDRQFAEAATASHDQETAEPSQLESELADLAATTARQQASSDELAVTATRLGNEIARLEGQLRAANDRAAILSNALPPGETRAVERARLIAESTRLEAAARVVIREVDALAEMVPGQVSATALADLVRGGEQDLDALNARLHRLDTDIAKLQGELASAAADGICERANELAGEFERARAAADRWTLEAKSLDLLCRTLSEVEQGFHDSAVTPVLRRMEPYLEHVFPGARLRLSDGFALESLSRGGATDAMGELSRGTREQIAVIARLGLAQLLTERGLHVPLILDDALVFSDDLRRTRMFELLARAAARHQVIVFSCHEAACAPLIRDHSASRLAMSPWAEAPARAMS